MDGTHNRYFNKYADFIFLWRTYKGKSDFIPISWALIILVGFLDAY